MEQKVRQKRDILERRSKTFTLFATQPVGYYATCEGNLTPKIYNPFFYQKLDAEYFFIQQFFQAVFLEKNARNHL